MDHHIRELSEAGLTKLRGLLPAAQINSMRKGIEVRAEDIGILSKGTWLTADQAKDKQKAFRSAINAYCHSSDIPQLIDKKVLDVTAALVGEPVTPMPPGQQILITLPNSKNWHVPHEAWHVDMPRQGELGPPGIQFFTFLDEVRPGGGGTLVVAGSHRLLNHKGFLRSKEIKQKLGAYPYFRHLLDPKRETITDHGSASGRADDVPLSLVELTGKPGDVWFMDLRALHAPAPNASDRLRMMVTCRLPRAAISDLYVI